MKRLQNMLPLFKADRSGNAAMIVALALPVLIGGSGFAVDVSQWYLWKRELQHSVDQAAYAGAWALARETSAGTYERRVLQEYNANLKVTRDFASTPSIFLADFDGGDQNSVVVTASASRTLPFSSFITKRGVTVSVSAQASFAEGRDFNACLVSTAETGTGTSIGGNATINARCGFAALSCDEDAIDIDGSAKIVTDSIVACGTINADGTINGSSGSDGAESVVAEGIKTLKDPFAGLEPALDTRPRTDDCTGKASRRQANLQPGTYSSLVVKCTTVLNKGIYVIDGGVLDLSGNYDVTGLGVQFVLRNGATVKLGGTGNNNRLNLTPPTADDLLETLPASRANELQGFLIIEDRNNNPPSPGHILNGNTNSVIAGNIYMPSGTLRINGTAKVTSQCLQITAYRIEVLGGAVLETFCKSDETNSVGSGMPDVRLVS